MLTDVECDESKLLARVTGRLLQQSDLLDRLTTAMTVLFAAALLLPIGDSSHSNLGYVFAASVGILLGVLGKWLAIRTRFDAALFGDIAAMRELSTNHSLERLDSALLAAGLIRVVRPRSLTDRVAGARRLFNCQAVALVLQIGVIFIYRLTSHA